GHAHVPLIQQRTPFAHIQYDGNAKPLHRNLHFFSIGHKTGARFSRVVMLVTFAGISFPGTLTLSRLRFQFGANR
ncbi:MAG: hypothetical protein KDA52_23410, partial [Planctomycetaceae bacterium]|nr:hypothetical protein [Planctomycetaceae bacterium]